MTGKYFVVFKYCCSANAMLPIYTYEYDDSKSRKDILFQYMKENLLYESDLHQYRVCIKSLKG